MEPRPSMFHSFSDRLRLQHGSKKARFNREREALLTSGNNQSNSQLSYDGLAEVEADEDEEHADADGLYPPNASWTADQKAKHSTEAEAARIKRADPFEIRLCPVFLNIHRIRKDIMESIDDPYSIEQLKAPRMNVSVIRPLVDQYFAEQDLSTIYCLLVNRSQFVRDHSFLSHHQTVNLTRALLCEIVADKLLRRYNEANPGPKGLLKLATILVAGFDPFQNAPDQVGEECAAEYTHLFRKNDNGWIHNKAKMTALEVAIIAESKAFLASSACQRVVDAIYKGKVIFSPTSYIDLIPDHWKKRPISLYDPRRGPLLNQYRLLVPRTRNILDTLHFVVLLGLYMGVMESRQTKEEQEVPFGLVEMLFAIYACGWVLEEIASILEHGWNVYTQNMWSFLDAMFSVIFVCYLSLRIHGLRVGQETDSGDGWGHTALDVLACGAPVLIPRLAFNFMSENMLIISLRGMMSDFVLLTALAVWSFAGFLLSMKWLHNDLHHFSTIGKWMIWIWFGLDGTGINEAKDFHWLLGPILMISFAFLGNTLFLTILVSMLSNTFSMIASNAVHEIRFRRAVLTFQGVKSDAIFAYWPPANLLALVTVLPLKFVVSPRIFHKINVVAMRVLNFPTLMLISWYERRTLWVSYQQKKMKPKIQWNNPFRPRKERSNNWAHVVSFFDMSRFGVHWAIQAVFEVEPPQELLLRHASRDDAMQAGGIGRQLYQDLQDQLVERPGRSEDALNADAGEATRKAEQDGDKQKHKPLSRTSTGKLMKDFTESGSDRDEEDANDHPKGHRVMRKKERMDSLADLNEGNVNMDEANARLQRLESGMERLESLIMRLVDRDEGSNDNSDAEQKLVERRETRM